MEDRITLKVQALLDEVRIDQAAVRAAVNEALTIMVDTIQTESSRIGAARETSAAAEATADDISDQTQRDKTLIEDIKTALSGDTTGLSTEMQKMVAGTQFIINSLESIRDGIISGLSTLFGIMEDIYGKLRESSPFLQAVESMLNLVMQLFFMPLGNKLAEILLPAVVEMLDKVVSMWDAFEGKTLGEMFADAFSEGIKILGDLLINIGEELSEEGGIVGAIGDLMKGIGTFIEKYLPTIMSVGADIMTFILENIPAIIAIIAGLSAAVVLGHAAIIAAILTSSMNPIAWAVGGSVAVAGAARLLTENAIEGYAEGGVIDPVPGGQFVLVGEGGEREFIIPESRMNMVSSSLTSQSLASSLDMSQNSSAQTVNITYNINGYTDNELKDIIRDTVNDQISKSRLRAGY